MAIYVKSNSPTKLSILVPGHKTYDIPANGKVEVETEEIANAVCTDYNNSTLGKAQVLSVIKD